MGGVDTGKGAGRGREGYGGWLGAHPHGGGW